MRVWTIAAAVGALMAPPAQANETRVAPGGHIPPPAQVEALDWLIGQWHGIGIGEAAAYESWLPSSGGTMVGSFVQETPAGGIMPARSLRTIFSASTGSSEAVATSNPSSDMPP